MGAQVRGFRFPPSLRYGGQVNRPAIGTWRQRVLNPGYEWPYCQARLSTVFS